MEPPENETLEYVASAGDRQAIASTLCAFANGKGGRLYIGIDDKGKIRGIWRMPEARRKVEAILRQLQPVPVHAIDVEVRGYHRILAITVQPLDAGPCFYKGRIWVRSGTANKWLKRIEWEERVGSNEGKATEHLPMENESLRQLAAQISLRQLLLLNEKEKEILQLLQRKQVASASILARELGISVPAALRRLKTLQTRGWVRKSGSRRDSKFWLNL